MSAKKEMTKLAKRINEIEKETVRLQTSKDVMGDQIEMLKQKLLDTQIKTKQELATIKYKLKEHSHENNTRF